MRSRRIASNARGQTIGERYALKMFDALWWIVVIAVGVAAGMVGGDWLRRGAHVPWVLYQGILVTFLVG